jgi:hypothetical protein
MLRLSKFELATLLFSKDTPRITLSDGSTGILLEIEREDGSGHNFNVRYYDEYNDVKSVYVRTIDN